MYVILHLQIRYCMSPVPKLTGKKKILTAVHCNENIVGFVIGLIAHTRNYTENKLIFGVGKDIQSV